MKAVPLYPEGQQPTPQPAGGSTIRSFDASDIVACVELFIDVFNGPPWNDAWTVKGAMAYLWDICRAPGFDGLVALDEDRGVVALMLGRRRRWWAGDEFLIEEICVRPSVQRRGLGGQLLLRLRERLEQIGCVQMVVATSATRGPLRFFERHGFREAGGMRHLVARV